jgi:hypothetical protein
MVSLARQRWQVAAGHSAVDAPRRSAGGGRTLPINYSRAMPTIDLTDDERRDRPDALTRDEHLARCKRRALEYVDAGDLTRAAASMASDLKSIVWKNPAFWRGHMRRRYLSAGRS